MPRTGSEGELSRVSRPVRRAPAPAPVSAEEAVRALEMARRAAESSHDTTFTGPRITADEWSLSQQGFSIRADLRQVLDTHGPGVYTVSGDRGAAGGTGHDHVVRHLPPGGAARRIPLSRPMSYGAAPC